MAHVQAPVGLDSFLEDPSILTTADTWPTFPHDLKLRSTPEAGPLPVGLRAFLVHDIRSLSHGQLDEHAATTFSRMMVEKMHVAWKAVLVRILDTHATAAIHDVSYASKNNNQKHWNSSSFSLAQIFSMLQPAVQNRFAALGSPPPVSSNRFELLCSLEEQTTTSVGDVCHRKMTLRCAKPKKIPSSSSDGFHPAAGLHSQAFRDVHPTVGKARPHNNNNELNFAAARVTNKRSISDPRHGHLRADSSNSVVQPKTTPEPVVVTTESAARIACSFLGKSSRIAVDCEGVALSRNGRLCIVQVASSHGVYIFDIVIGGNALFDGGLRALLESRTTLKVMHDCRHDCDALLHQFQARVEPVLDTQVAFFVLRRLRQQKVGLPASLKTLLKKFSAVPLDEVAMKDDVKLAMREKTEFWLVRPLSREALKYACMDVAYLLDVATVLERQVRDASSSTSSPNASWTTVSGSVRKRRAAPSSQPMNRSATRERAAMISSLVPFRGDSNTRNGTSLMRAPSADVDNALNENPAWDVVLKESAAYAGQFRDDADGPRKAEIVWLREVCAAKRDRAQYERKQTLKKLEEMDAMRSFRLDRERVVQALLASSS